MSENITHTAVTDDLSRLARHSPTICDPFKLVLEEHLRDRPPAGVTRSGGKFVPPLLEEYRAAWPGHETGDWLPEKLAFVLGWLFHRAADLQMKPIFHATDSACTLDPTDCSVYHDVFLFREVYAWRPARALRAGPPQPRRGRAIVVPIKFRGRSGSLPQG